MHRRTARGQILGGVRKIGHGPSVGRGCAPWGPQRRKRPLLRFPFAKTRGKSEGGFLKRFSTSEPNFLLKTKNSPISLSRSFSREGNRRVKREEKSEKERQKERKIEEEHSLYSCFSATSFLVSLQQERKGNEKKKQASFLMLLFCQFTLSLSRGSITSKKGKERKGERGKMGKK